MRAATAIAIAGSLTAVTAGVTAAQAAPAGPRKTEVVKIATRHPFGRVLTTAKGEHTLYLAPMGGCTGQCLSIWPALLMPKGRHHPSGTPCLGTAKFGKRLQVTYRGKRLYLFSGDTGHSASGNGIGGFKVAKLVVKSCPKK